MPQNLKQAKPELTRISLDVTKDEHKQIKIMATFKDQSIRDYIRQCIQDQLARDRQVV